jgi:hypothetical protein
MRPPTSRTGQMCVTKAGFCRVETRGWVLTEHWNVLPAKEAGGQAALSKALSALERSRLAVEGTLCRESMPAAEQGWARKHRPKEAAHWKLLTTLTVDQLTYA